ncbi:restriction endonuclease subunit S [Corynebacterium lizhenjunii]|uniref:restriction endonuclease subunit S n=1 Tax=Corynebacterium lizhenjunii TaxID=2709394 RepID=UPI0013E9BE94|nr:restriction endonuclease subunit S [Corynebacterium lizhenjunii]
MTTTQHDWPMVKLGDVLQEFTTRPTPEQQAGTILTLTEKNGFMRQEDRFSKRLALENTSKYKVIRRGEFALNPYLLWAGAIALNTRFEEGIISPLYPTFRVSPTANAGYLNHLFKTEAMISRFDQIAFGSVPRKRRTRVSDFLSLQVPLPPLEEQHRIAGILDHVGTIIGAQRGLIEAMEELSQTTLNALLSHESRMTVELAEIADIQSGITKGRKVPAGQSTESVPYLAVSNVKDGFLHLEQVSKIDATNNEIAKYLLRAGDLVLTEGGDPDKLGRGTVWNEELPRCIHQNHIFRVRIRPESSEITPEVLAAALRTPNLKQYFLKSAKQTTGIASINKTQLSQAPIPLLNSDEVGSIAETIVALQAELALERKRLDSLIGLHKVLSIRAFQGEL